MDRTIKKINEEELQETVTDKITYTKTNLLKSKADLERELDRINTMLAEFDK